MNKGYSYGSNANISLLNFRHLIVISFISN